MKKLFKTHLANQQNNARRTIAEKLKIAEELRDLQEKLAPLRAANKAAKAKRKIQVPVKPR